MEKEMIIVEETGACKFCGQIRRVDVDSTLTDEQINEHVTRLCKCEDATDYTRIIEQKDRAVAKIEEMFGEESEAPIFEEVVNILKDAAEQIVNQKMHAVTVEIGKGHKAKISKNAKGNIKIERSISKKRCAEE